MTLEKYFLGCALTGVLSAQAQQPDAAEVVEFAVFVAEKAAARARELWGDDDEDDPGDEAA